MRQLTSCARFVMSSVESARLEDEAHGVACAGEVCLLASVEQYGLQPDLLDTEEASACKYRQEVVHRFCN